MRARTSSEQKKLVKRCWKERNRQKVLAEHRSYNKAHKMEINLKEYTRRTEARKAFLSALGGKCVKCGFGDWRGLQIDHINGGGSYDVLRRVNTRLYQKVVQVSFLKNEGKYQILCANCNQIKRYVGS